MKQTNTREFYESFWGEHRTSLETQLAIHQESRRPLLRLLENSLPKDRPACFLEVGCGTALDSCLLMKRCAAARGVAMDLSVRAVALAKANAAAMQLPLETLAADLTALPFPEASFDLVFSQGVLEHFTDPAPAMAEQARVLRPGGVLVVDVPQKFNPYTWIKHRAMRENRWPWGWETEYSVSELRAWGAPLGLEPRDAVGHQHGRILDRALVHPHRFVHRKLHRSNGSGNGAYRPGPLARAWEGGWDWIDSAVGPYLAINVAVAFRKPN